MVQLTQALQEAFPGLEVVQSAYPIAPAKALAAQLVFASQIGLAGLLMFGQQAFPFLGMAVPQWYLRMQESRGTALIAIWFGVRSSLPRRLC